MADITVLGSGAFGLALAVMCRNCGHDVTVWSKFEEEIIGTAEVRQVFKISNVGTVAGAMVLTGKIERNAGVRVIRDDVVIHEGKLISLKRYKDDAKEVAKDFECGIQIEKFNDIKEKDIIEAFILKEIKR